MPKILMVSTIAPTLRGFLLPFADHFRSQGWQVDGLAQGTADCAICQTHFDQAWDVHWSRNPLDFNNLRATPQWIQHVVTNTAYDIVHVHTPIAAFVTRYALRHLRRDRNLSVIYTAHGFHFYPGGNPIKNTIFAQLEKQAGQWTDYLMVINRVDETAAKRLSIVSPERVVYCPGIGVDLAYYNPQTIDAEAVLQVRQSLNLSPQTALFLGIAEFNPGKRHRDMITAFAQLQDPHAHLAFAGTGPLEADMQALAQQLGIRDRVHFLGLRRDIPVLIRAAIATIHASEREGLPRSVMESLALEIPVIGTQIRGTSELLAGGGGILVPVGDIGAIQCAMQQIIADPSARRTMGEKGRNSMSTFDLKSVIQCHESLYQQALARSQERV
jgi:glycosyltransferase involved in cell wall biosynthesis